MLLAFSGCEMKINSQLMIADRLTVAILRRFPCHLKPVECVSECKLRSYETERRENYFSETASAELPYMIQLMRNFHR